MVWTSSAQGIRPYAPLTRQTVCIVVTPTPEYIIFCPLCFQSLAHSFENGISAILLESCLSALFAQNTGGGYTPPISPHLFKRLRTLQDQWIPDTQAVRACGERSRTMRILNSPGRGLSVPGSSRPRWRRAGEDVLDDLPPAAWLAFEDDHVAAFGRDFRARRDGG
jgi:hypothetical protein